MNNKEFIAELSQRMGYSIADTQKLVNTIINSMSAHFQESEPVMVQNFGLFEIKKKLERVIVNPSTHQRMLVPPKLILTFKPNTLIKEKVKKGGLDNE